ncbi:MAG: anaerobic ribonucleoside-triphosphate reductase activating protein, partial [Thermoprotei archaeon]
MSGLPASLKNTYILIGGWKENSLVDVLESVSFTLWTSHCNFKCPWCGNSKLARGLEARRVSIADIIGALERNADFIDYFHVTGGEPTLQPKPLRAMFQYIAKNLEVKNSLDTNGSNPRVIKRLARYLDHVAIDIKAPLSQPNKYSMVIGLPLKAALEAIMKVKNCILFSCREVPFLELRTTVVPGMLDIRDVIEIAIELKNLIKDTKARVAFVVQQFIPYENILDSSFR